MYGINRSSSYNRSPADSLCDYVTYENASYGATYRAMGSPVLGCHPGGTVVDHEDERIAKRLEKARLIDHFNHKHLLFTLARRASGDCQFLDAQTRRCTVYDQRPDTCRKHPQVGPRPGYCAYAPADGLGRGRR